MWRGPPALAFGALHQLGQQAGWGGTVQNGFEEKLGAAREYSGFVFTTKLAKPLRNFQSAARHPQRVYARRNAADVGIAFKAANGAATFPVAFEPIRNRTQRPFG
jgi:hypothetical protein